MKLRPLFMWAGGKTKMIPQYAERLGIPYEFDVYVEPFFGGGAMFCELYNRGAFPAAKPVISDSNQELMNLYRHIREDCEGLIYVLKIIEDRYLKMSYAKRKEHYYLVRNAYAFNALGCGLLDSATLLFLLKTGFNGIYQTLEGSDRFASPCGLLNQTEAVFDYELIREWNRALQNTNIFSCDWSELVGDYDEAQVFYFLDPPYRDSFKHYGVSDFDHDRLIAKAVHVAENEDAIVWLCNRWTDDTYYMDRAKGALDIDTFDVTYTAGRRKKNEDGTHSAVKAQEVLLNNVRRL